MKKIVIVGSSVAGVRAAERIRLKEPSWEIVLVLFEDGLPYDKDRYADIVSGEIRGEEAFLHPESFYNEKNIQIVRCQGLSRINTKRQVITTAEKDQIDYDKLILTDLPGQKFPSIKGTNKEGVYNLKRLEDLLLFEKTLVFADAVTIQSGTLSGILIAEALRQKGKEVVVTGPGENGPRSLLPPEIVQSVLGDDDQDSFMYLPENTIAEILGEGDVRAIRLATKKVLASQAVVFCDPILDVRLFLEMPELAEGKIRVDAHYASSLENVFALDYLADDQASEGLRSFPDTALLEKIGDRLGRHLIGEDLAAEKYVPQVSMVLKDRPLTCLGEIGQTEDVVSMDVQAEGGAIKKLFVRNNCLVGAILTDNQALVEQVFAWIRQAVPLEQIDINLSPVGLELSAETSFPEAAVQGEDSGR